MKWLGAILHILAAAGILMAIARTLVRWKIELYGQSVRREVPGIAPLFEYTFVIQNAEDYAVTVPVTFEIALEKAGTHFKDEEVRLYCGFESRYAYRNTVYRSDTRGTENQPRETGSARAVHVIEVERMRARDTWVIHFVSEATPGNVALRVRPRKIFSGLETPVPLIEPMELRLWESSTRASILSQRSLPAIVLGALGVCALLYTYPIFNRALIPPQLSALFVPFNPLWDLLALLLVSGMTCAIFLRTHPKPPRFIQGYRDAQPRRPDMLPPRSP